MDLHGVDQAVLIGARLDGNPRNNHYISAASRRNPGRLHAFPDLDSYWSGTYHRSGAVRRLAAMLEAWSIRGFTHYVEEPNDGWLTSRAGLEVFKFAAENDLIASLSVSPGWHEDVRAVARAFPTLIIVCHHLGGVGGSDSELHRGVAEVLKSAALPNIFINVSGFHHGPDPIWDYPYPKMLRATKELYEGFGPQRMCWGSDFPVVQHRAMTYRQALEVFRAHCDFIPERDQALILGETLAALLGPHQTQPRSSR
jgi:predicted TIM-barrel fold metal-dependent hydrolase